VLSRRGLVLLPAAAVSALAGLAYGVAEFVILAAGAGALFVGGWASLAWQLHRARGALALHWARPAADVYVDSRVAVVLHAVAVRAGGSPPLEVGGLGRWRLSHPGLSASGAALGADAEQIRRGGTARRATRMARRLGLGAGERARLPALGATDEWSMAVPVPTTSRGLWSIAPLELWCTDAFGLVRWRLGTTPSCHVVVFPDPRAHATNHEPDERPRPLRRGSDMATDAGPSGGDEFEGLRPYQPGDRLTRLHWPALARDELMSRHFVELDEHRLRLPVDTRPWTIEDSVSQAAALGAAALAASTPVELYTAQGERVLAVPGPWGLRVLLRALALVPPAPVSSPLLRGRRPAVAGRPAS
jgi:hypothetical protein